MDNVDLRAKVLEFLKSNFIMNVATAVDNDPRIAVLLYHVDDQFNFYFTTHTDSQKVKNLRANPRISLAVWEFGKMMVHVEGQASEVTDPEQKLTLIDKVAESSTKGEEFWPPLLRIKGEEYSVFMIKPESMRMLDLSVDTMTQTGSPFTDVSLQ